MALETLFNFNLQLTSDADINITVQGQHQLSAGGSQQYGLFISLDGTTLNSGGGTNPPDLPMVMGFRKAVPGGTLASPRSVPVVVQWYGTTAMKITQINVIVNIRYR